MKSLTKTLIAASFLTSFVASATEIGLSETSTDSFTIGGTIESECKVSTTSNDSSLDLTGESGSNPQTSAAVNTWCNTGDSTVTTTFSSLNGGNLINEHGNTIAYTINVGDAELGDSVATGLSLSSDQDVELGLDTDEADVKSGQQTSRNVSIIPAATGYDYAGTYTDTITVTVSAS